MYGDLDADGVFDAFETGIPGATVTLTGTNDLGAITPIVVATGAGGAYSFTNLRPGTYAITETQPTGYSDGAETLGSGLTAPNNVGATGADTFTGIVFSTVAAGNTSGVNYNFGESPNFGLTKSLQATSLAATTGANLVAGEIATFRLVATIPAGSFTNFQIQDALPAGYIFLNNSTAVVSLVSSAGQLTSSTLSGAGLAQTSVGTPTFGLPDTAISTSTTVNADVYASGTDVFFKLGNLTNTDTNGGTTESVVIEFQAMVTNEIANQAGSTLDNTFSVLFDKDGNPGPEPHGPPSPPVTTTIAEPNVTISKTVDITSNVDAGDVITYTVTLTNPGGANGSTAFDTLLVDTMPANLLVTGITSTTLNGGATSDSAAAIGGGGTSITGQYDIPAGGSVVVVYTATVQVGFAPNGSVTNAAVLTWTSLNGGNSTAPDANERFGAAGSTFGDGSLNDFRRTTSVTTTGAGPTFSKVLFSTSDAGTTGSNVGIGETVTYGLLVTLPEGTTSGFNAADALPPGLQYTGFSIVTTAAASNGLLTANFGGTVPAPTVTGGATDGADVNFAFGAITTNGDNVTTNNTFLILVNTVVTDIPANTGLVPQTVLPNSATFTGTGIPPTTPPPINVTLTEPRLQVAKGVDDVTADLGQTLTYTLTITHTASSTQTAYDLILRDAIPAGMTLNVGSIAIAGGTIATNTSTAAQLALTVDQLNTGGTITITYTATVGTGAALVGTNLDNNARIFWDSLADDAGSNAVLTNVADGTADRDFGATFGYVEAATPAPDDLAQDTVRVSVNGNTISGTVYGDTDASGTLNGAETGINNVALTLSGTTFFGIAYTQNATTNASGAYSFTNVPRGTYTITETQPAGFIDGVETVGTTFGGTVSAALNSNTISTLTVPVGVNTGTGYNFGELLASSLAGTTYRDLNNDGLINGTDTTINGVTVALTGTDVFGQAVSLSTATAGAGAYAFAGLRPGTYTITETQPAALLDGRETVGAQASGTVNNTADSNTISAIALAQNVTGTGNNFGELPAASFAATVYRDLNNNGVQLGAGETGISGVTVTLTGTDDRGAAVSTALATDGSGNVSYTNLRPGTYTITETQPAGFNDGIDSNGTPAGTLANDVISAITLTAGTAGTGYAFGELPTTSISGTVYRDLNNDGIIFGAGETGIQTVTVVLSGIDDLGVAVSLSTTTDVNGNYSFTGLRPSNAAGYTLTETQPAGLLDGRETVGTQASGTVNNGANSNTISSIVLAAGVAGTGNNFGELPPASFAAVVYRDLNNDGVQLGAGETGILNATVTLTGTDDRGNAVSTPLTTDASGNVSFSNLRPGTYTITETTPAGFLDGRDTNGTPAGTLTNDTVSTITLTAGTSGTGYTFGELPPSALSGTVYRDLNNDGIILGAGETGIQTVTVTLTGIDDLGAVVSLSTTTAADGSYSFASLRPSNATGYTLTETQPAGLLDGRETVGSQASGTVNNVANSNTISGIVLGTNTTGTGNNFGELPPASFAAVVYRDLNNNGVQLGAGETGILNATVTLTGTDDRGTVVSAALTTDAVGNVSFTNLRPGTYTITETTPAGFLDGRDTNGTPAGTLTNDTVSTITLTAGTAGTGYAFGELPPSSVSGTVYRDLNNNGAINGGEAGIQTVTVVLSGIDDLGAAVSLSTTTDVNGNFTFSNLRPSNATGYTLTETQPAGLLDGLNTVGTSGGAAGNPPPGDAITGIVIGTNTTATGYLFGELPTSSLAGTVYRDLNNNGAINGGETGIDGVTVTLTGSNDLGAITPIVVTTSGGGLYSFGSLRPGTYTITETQPGGFNDGIDTQGTPGGGTAINDAFQNITLAANTNGTGNNFGELPTTSLSGTVFRDNNNNGTVNAGETGIQTVTVTLTGLDDLGAAVNVSMLTDVNGNYSFTGLRPSSAAGYTVTETQPAGFLDGLNTVGTNGGTAGNPPPGDAITGIVLTSGTSATGYNFGELNPASLSGAVYGDLDADGVFDAFESGITGVTVTLTGTNDLGAITPVVVTTGAGGAYSFSNLRPGTYVITETQPLGYADGADTLGTGLSAPNSAGAVGADTFTTITFASVAAGNTSGVNYNFGESPNFGLTKSLQTTSVAGTTGTNVSIGEVATFRLVATIPSGSFTNFQLQDALPAGFQFINGSAVVSLVSSTGQLTSSTLTGGTLAQPVVGTPTFGMPDAAVSNNSTTNVDAYLSGADVFFKLGDLTNTDTNGGTTESVVIEFQALVVNEAANQAAATLPNTFSVLFDKDGTGAPDPHGPPSNTITTTVTEPVLAVTKVLQTSGTDAGEAVQYVITITNAAANNAAAYDISVLDAIDSDILLNNVTLGSGIVVSGATVNANTSTTSSLNLVLDTLAAGASVTVTLNATVVAAAPAGATVANSTTVAWTSTPGVSANERTGAGGLNDYTAVATSANFTLARPTVDKLTPADTTYSIGEQVTFNILVTLPEGVTTGVSLSDVLPTGLTFVSSAVQTAAGGVLANSFGGTVGTPTANGANTLFTFGDITTTGDNNAANNQFVFSITAIVDNVLGNQSGTSFTNSAAFSYTDGTLGAQTLNDSAGAITVVEPRMFLDKSVAAPSTGLQAGDTATYTITFSNLAANGATATAFDALIADSVPAGVLITSVNSVNFIGAVTQDAAVTITGGGAGLSGQFDIPVDGTVTITYTGTLQTSVNPGASYTNTATLTFSSTNGANPNERTGSTPNVQGDGSLNDYRLTDTATVSTATTFNLVKTSPAGPFTVGDLVPYTLTLTLLEGTTPNVVIQDTLPAGFQFAGGSVVVTPGSGMSTSFVDEATSFTVVGQTATVNLGSVVNPAGGGNTVTITFNALVLDDGSNVATTAGGETKTNSASATGTGVPPTGDSRDVQFVEPRLVVTKGVSDSTPDINQVVTYTVTIGHAANSGTTAYDIRVRDLLPAGLDLDEATLAITSAPGTTSINAGSNVSAGNLLDFTLNQLGLGESVTFTYQARVVNTLGTVGTTQSNNARLYWDSQAADEPLNVVLDGGADGTPDRDYGATPGYIEDGTPIVDDPAQDSVTLTVNTNAITGTVYRDADASGSFTAGDVRLDAVSVRLTGTTFGGLAVDFTTQSVNGDYSFVGLSAGNYMLTETQPAGLVDGVETVGTSFGGSVSNALGSDTILGITIPAQSASVGASYNFGEVNPSSFAGSVYHDLDNDGFRDALETGVASSIQITGTDAFGEAVDTTVAVTGAGDGRFLFSGLRPGIYTLTQVGQPVGYLDGKDTAGTSGGTADSLTSIISAITVPQGTTATDYLFGEVIASTLSGNVYVDGNNDGAIEAGEKAIGGVLITLSGTDDRGNPVSGTFNTLADGTFTFGGLRPGNYTLTETQPAAYSDGLETAGSLGATVGNDSLSNITTTSGDVGTAYNFGERGATVSGNVFRDLDRAGDLDAGTDTGIGGVTLTLRDSGNAIVATTTSNPDGTYQFTDLAAGDYTIVQTQPLGYGSSTPNTLAITVPIGGLTGRNFGETLSTFSGLVFRDDANDGIFNGTDEGIGAVVVRLTGTDAAGNAVDRTTTTAGDGTYTFDDVLGGTYTIRETQPVGYNDGSDTLGSLGGTLGNDVVSAITMPVATDATGYNFAEALPPQPPGRGAISGIVFRDADRDGTLEAGDTGISSVALQLLDGGGNVVATTTTSADGKYALTNILPGTYSIRETQPNGFGSSTPNTIPGVVVVANQTVTDQLFGETTSGLSGKVFTDLDKDGVFTTGEPGISGVTLTLTGTNVNGAAVSATTLTDANGDYAFDGLIAGTYRIVETQPVNRIDGLDHVGTSGGTAENDVLRNIALNADILATGYNFGELLPTLSGTVFRDDNVNGTLTAGEPGIGGVTLTLRDNLNNVIATTTSNADGTYEFVNVLPGAYTITETQPAGYGNSSPNVLNVTATNADVSGINFGETTSSLAGTVFRDVDNSATLTAGDVGIGGVTIRLTGVDAQGSVIDITTTTNPDGTYLFDRLLGGTYFITETQPSGFDDGAESVGTAGGDGNINDVFGDIGLGNGFTATGYNFAETITTPPGQGAVTGVVWLDQNRDATLDGGEPGVGGVTVQLVDSGNNVVGSAVTGPDGHYTINGIAPGIYTVRQLQPGGYGSSTPNSIGAVAVVADTVTEDVSFGETLGSIAGTVFRDVNNDGAQLGAAETGIAGVTITLSGFDINDAPVLRTAVTDANGTYVFDDLLASNGAGYAITETQPAAFNDGLDALGTLGGTLANDSASGIVLTVTGDNVTDATGYTFGERGTTITGNVWVDRDRDGIREPATEPNSLAGVLITLLDSNDNVVATTTTDNAGNYTFSDVDAGDYTLVETQPNGYGSSTLNVVAITVPTTGLAGQNFGETASTISGLVFRDDNLDGAFNGSDAGIAGVEVTLTGTDANGAAVSVTATTDTNGNYVFIDLLEGNYTVAETQPDDYSDGADLIGSVGGLNLVNDRISSIGLGFGQDVTDYSFGEIFRFDPEKILISTSNPGTSGANVSIGETIRFRLIIALPDSALNDFVLAEYLPKGLVFQNDGTAAVAFLSNSGTGLASSTLSGPGLGVTHDTFAPTVLLSDTQVSSSSTANEDIYHSGTSVFFKLGNITNNETQVSDPDREFVFLEFNARVVNEAANQNGHAMDNTFAPRFDITGDGVNDPLPPSLVSPPTRTVVAEPILALDKQITAGPKAPKPGDVITFTVTIRHAADSHATAWETLFSDTLPKGMTLVNISTKANGGAVVTNAVSANGASISGQFDIPVGGSITITYKVRIGAAVKGGTTLTNGADVTWTSMPGDQPTERKSGDSLLNQGGLNDYELVAKSSVKITAPPPQTAVPFFWDGFNKLGYPTLAEQFSPYPIIPSDNDIYRPAILPLQPIYAGEADPGSTLVLTMFNAKGESIGTQTVVVDSGGNWLATFPSTTIRDTPNTVQISQLSAYYSIGSGVGHNLRTYYSPALNAGHFFYQSLVSVEVEVAAPLLNDLQMRNPINAGAVKYSGEVLASQGAARGY